MDNCLFSALLLSSPFHNIRFSSWNVVLSDTLNFSVFISWQSISLSAPTQMPDCILQDCIQYAARRFHALCCSTIDMRTVTKSLISRCSILECSLIHYVSWRNQRRTASLFWTRIIITIVIVSWQYVKKKSSTFLIQSRLGACCRFFILASRESTVFPYSFLSCTGTNRRRVVVPVLLSVSLSFPRSMRSINLYSATFFSLSYYRRSKIPGNFQRFEGQWVAVWNGGNNSDG